MRRHRLETVIDTTRLPPLDKAGNLCYKGRTVIAFYDGRDWQSLFTIQAIRKMIQTRFVKVALIENGVPEGELETDGENQEGD